MRCFHTNQNNVFGNPNKNVLHQTAPDCTPPFAMIFKRNMVKEKDF
jgi:hypothetical protein